VSREPLVSVVMPSFHQARFVREAIESVLEQGYGRLELLVIDGGSTDGTLEILKSYGERIRFVSEPDRGQSDAINKGFAHARGEIVTWLNSDDRQVPGAIRSAVDALAAEPAAAMVYGDGELIGENGAVLARAQWTQPFDLWTLIYVIDFIMQPTVFMRRSRLAEVGALDESLHYAMDWDLWIRFGCRWPVAYVPRVLAQTREYGATKTASGGWRRLRELRRILRRHGAPGWPPAAVGYGLDTLRRRWPWLFGPASAADVERLATQRLARWLAPLHRRMLRLIDDHLLNAQGLWRDGWAGPLVHKAVPWADRPGVVEVHGEVWPLDPRLLPFSVEASAGRGAHTRVELSGPGPFTLRLPIPARKGPPRALPIAIRATRSFRTPRDPRRLSYRFGDLRYVAPCA
jgi:hypothetical protein